MALPSRLADLKNCGIEQFTFAGFCWPRHVANLERGTLAARLKARKSRCTSGYYHAPRPGNTGRGFYLESDGMPELRWQYADEACGSIRHTGWYCDDDGSQTIRGVVFRLPKGRGFLAGWTMGEHMVSSVDYDIFDNERDAALAADSMAESAAETEREYQERMRAEDEARELEESTLGTDE